MSNLIVFDLDGVITSEAAYWDTAGLTLHELCYSPRYWDIDGSQLSAGGQYHPAATAEESRRVSRAILPEAEILALKARAINSNWDTCYAVVCIRLIDLLVQVPDVSGLLPLRPWDGEWLAEFRKKQYGGLALRLGGEKRQGEDKPQQGGGKKQGVGQSKDKPRGYNRRPYYSPASQLVHFFDSPVAQSYVGLELINRFDAYASQVLGYPVEGVFSRYSPFWTFCQDIFQEWYLGDELYTQTYGHAPAQLGKPGCVHFEQPLLPVERIGATLEMLRKQGYVLGFATGRVYQEAAYPLKMYGLLQYFDEEHIATYDYVERAEAELRAHGDSTLLGKPHPFQFLVALDHGYEHVETLNNDSSRRESFVVVGDSTSDILGGRAAGAVTVAVLTGARTPEARQLLERSGPDFVIEDMTGLPELLAHIDGLATIQRLQFSEREKAERLLRRWFARHMHLQAESVTLIPKAVSLNSFNGFYRLDGEEYFFKTHVEEQGVLEEYYNAELLHQAGYNIVRPLQTLHEEGRQMVVYPVVRWPVMFDLVRAIETGKAEDVTHETLVAAERRECERLLAIYEKTLARSTAEENARAPIHQLFWHRLTGGRLKSFYEGKVVPFPNRQFAKGMQKGIAFEELLRCRWIVDEIKYRFSLGELIEYAKVVLNPMREAFTVVGHGDAHFGNVFLEDQKDFLYFDPAFAGRHSPLLDVVKPLYHNVDATWMYFPDEVAQDLELFVSVCGRKIYVEHNYDLNNVRYALFTTKMRHLLMPLNEMLQSYGALPPDWSELQFFAMMCCPLLTMNLLDGKRMPPKISWLGLTEAVKWGNFAKGGNFSLRKG